MFSKSSRSKGRQSDPTPKPVKLPAGAEAALWSIVEVIPDPRNHLALTRDPTAEVRLTRSAIDAALALASPLMAEAPAPSPLEARHASTLDAPVVASAGPPTPRASWLPAQLAERPEPAPAMPVARRNTVRWSSDTAEVRLPAFITPQVADAEPPADPADASVHALEPPASPPLLPVQRRYARGA